MAPLESAPAGFLGAEFLPQDLVLLLEVRDHILSVIFAGPALRSPQSQIQQQWSGDQNSGEPRLFP